jgi:hypothetical protein
MAKKKKHFVKLRAFNWGAPQIPPESTYNIIKVNEKEWSVIVPMENGREGLSAFVQSNGIVGLNRREFPNGSIPDTYEFFKDAFMIVKELQGSWIDRQIVVYPNPEDGNECVKIERNELVELQTVLTYT